MAALPDIGPLAKEISRVYSYWASRGDGQPEISRVVVAGHGAVSLEAELRRQGQGSDDMAPSAVADVWRGGLDLDRYIPPISRDGSLDYAVAAGLALRA